MLDAQAAHERAVNNFTQRRLRALAWARLWSQCAERHAFRCAELALHLRHDAIFEAVAKKNTEELMRSARRCEQARLRREAAWARWDAAREADIREHERWRANRRGTP